MNSPTCEPCARCGHPATGRAWIGGNRYCHSVQPPSCYELAQLDMTDGPLHIDDILRQWAPDGDFDWPTTFSLLDRARLSDVDALAEDVQFNGIREPVRLGDDGRVRDGHLRLLVADLLGIEAVPVVKVL